MNWAKRLLRGVRRGKFTKEDVEEAFYWNSCAVGEVTNGRVVLPRTRLRRLGTAFLRAVQHNKPKDALLLYLQINQKR